MKDKKSSLKATGKTEFTLHPPRRDKKLKAQKGCLCLDKLVNEEIDRHAKNIAFQKSLVKRLEASERRISYGEFDEDEDEEDVKKKPRKGLLKLGKPKDPDYHDCFCDQEIKKEEKKRRKFVKRLEKEQIRYEKRNLKAQKKYEKRRIKVFRRCKKIQDAIDKEYAKGDKTVMINQGDERYRVFLHMERKCGFTERGRCKCDIKLLFYKCCTITYIVLLLIGGTVFYMMTTFHWK